MQRPCAIASDPKAIDEGTDTYDTIDWLLKNIPNNNGRVGLLGISYGGWLTVMALLEPHPALKAVSEQASPADMFLGDDFHHNGAFRLSYGFEYASDDGNRERRILLFHFDQVRHVRVVSRARPALECERKVFSRESSRPGTISWLIPITTTSGRTGVYAVASRIDADGAESECRGLVGSGGFLRSGEDL